MRKICIKCSVYKNIKEHLDTCLSCICNAPIKKKPIFQPNEKGLRCVICKTPMVLLLEKKYKPMCECNESKLVVRG